MMKISVIILIGIVLVTGLYFVYLSILSRKQPELGLQDGMLSICPATPNCVCSEYPDSPGYISPLQFTIPDNEAVKRIKKALQTMGGNIIGERAGYIHAIFESRLFRFIDDVELRMDAERQLIHFRSASRVGHSDFGANKKRIDRLRLLFNSIDT